MEFWDREREIERLKRYLQTEPNAILFVYGPKSSGKTTLLAKVLHDLKDILYPYFYDLRLVPVSSYKDVLSIFFRERGWKQRLKEAIPGMASSVARYFEVDGEVLKEILSMDLNPFEVMEGVLRGKRKRGKKPVVVFDEIQKLRGIYMNGEEREKRLVDELFNFFVRITKVEHIAHVIVMTSDTFLIEDVYSSSALKNTSEFYLVDYFDDDTAKKILVESGNLSEKEAEYVVEWIGGVPWMMERIISNGDVKEKVKSLFMETSARLEDVLAQAYEMGMYDDVVEMMKKVLDNEVDTIRDRKMIKWLVEREVLYFDPIRKEVKFQTRLDEKAAKELIGWSSGTERGR